MVQLQEVYRYLLRPVEARFKAWEAKPGLKGTLARMFRIGMAPRGFFEAIGKVFNNVYMQYIMFTHRPWGPVYKRLMEFDVNPGRLYFLFCRHRWIYGFWFGNFFMMEDVNYVNMMRQNPDYLLYYSELYGRIFPRNTLNWRTSAHYIEINRIYTFEMVKKALLLEKEYWEDHQRNKALNAASQL